MTQRRQTVIQKILAERERQLNLPGSEFDISRTPNDWLAIAGRYLFNPSSTKNIKSSKVEFEEDLIKAAAVIVAALENVERMRDNDHLKG